MLYQQGRTQRRSARCRAGSDRPVSISSQSALSLMPSRAEAAQQAGGWVARQGRGSQGSRHRDPAHSP